MRLLKRILKPVLKPPLDAAQRMLRRRDLKAKLTHVTQQSLEDDLDALDLGEAPVVLVHTSLKRIGFVEGGPDAVVGALVASIVERRGGTLALPTFSIDGTMRNTFASGRVFDVRSTPCNLGAIPEAFRKHPGVMRSIHPTHSIAALGPQAEWLVSDHHRVATSFGADTPMVRMLECGGWLMGIGTHLGTVTFYHCVEDLDEHYPLDVYSEDSPFTVECVDWEGRSLTRTLPAHSPTLNPTRIDRPENEPLRSFFTQRFERDAGLSRFPVGETEGWLIRFPAMYEACRALLDEGVTIYTPADELPQSPGSD